MVKFWPVGKPTKRPSGTKRHFLFRHKHLKHGLFVLLAIVVVLAGLLIYGKVKVALSSRALWRLLYNTSGLSLAGPMGQVVRSEPVKTSVTNGSATRVLYRTQRADGSVTFSSGLVFIPNNSSAGTPRPVVAWAHGTVGMGDACAPSRLPDPASNISWVSQMLQRGWVVTATDYAGLGTPGIEGYLVGGDEARDVLNSVPPSPKTCPPPKPAARSLCGDIRKAAIRRCSQPPTPHRMRQICTWSAPLPRRPRPSSSRC